MMMTMEKKKQQVVVKFCRMRIEIVLVYWLCRWCRRRWHCFDLSPQENVTGSNWW